MSRLMSQIRLTEDAAKRTKNADQVLRSFHLA